MCRSYNGVVAVDVLKAVLLGLHHKVPKLILGLNGGGVYAQGFGYIAPDKDAVSPVGFVLCAAGQLPGQDILSAVKVRMV